MIGCAVKALCLDVPMTAAACERGASQLSLGSGHQSESIVDVETDVGALDLKRT
jgi:hypothetical protein